MNVILTNIDNPLVSESINRGHIVIDELKIWSAWKQHSNFIASYQWRSQPNVVRRIEIGNDEVVTFKVISEAFNSKLNESSAGATIARLSYVDGKINLYLKPDTQLFNVKIADDIARELRIKPDRPNTGELVDADKIALHNVDSIFMTCDQAKSNTYINSQRAETILASTPFNNEVEVTSFGTSNPALFYAPVKDKWGNKLPVKKLFCRLRINDDKRLRGENIPSDISGNSTA